MAKKPSYKIICRCPSLNWVLVRKDKNLEQQGWYKLSSKKDAEKITITAFRKIKNKKLAQGVDIF